MSIKLERHAFLFSIIAIPLSIMVALRPIGIDSDSINYFLFFEEYAEKMNVFTKEPGFWLLVNLSLIFSLGLSGLFFFFAIISISIKMRAISVLSSTPIYAFFIYICLFFILHEMTQIRVSVSIAIFLLSIRNIYKKELGNFVFKIIIASIFHYSALIFLILYPLNSISIRKWVYYLLPLFGFFLTAQANIFEVVLNVIASYMPIAIQAKFELYKELSQVNGLNSVNFANIFTVISFVSYYLLVFKFECFKSPYKAVYLNCLLVSLLSFFSLSFLPVFAFRISEMFGIVMVFVLSEVHQAFRQKLVAIASVSAFAFFYFFFVSVSKMLFLNL